MANQRVLDDGCEPPRVFGAETHFPRPLIRPAVRTVERGRRYIGGEERDAVETELARCNDDVRQIFEIQTLQNATRRNRKTRVALAQRGDAIGQTLECVRNSPDAV